MQLYTHYMGISTQSVDYKSFHGNNNCEPWHGGVGTKQKKKKKMRGHIENLHAKTYVF